MRVTGKSYRARLDICKRCVYRSEAVGGLLKLCTVCGCPIGVKAWFKGADCPKGYWEHPELMAEQNGKKE